MVEVFKTNVEEFNVSKKLTQTLIAQFPESRINFDLKDCDKILRVEGNNILPERIIELVTSQGYLCEVLM
jgi:hypothetical protein